jgi:hypothetical protein
MKTKPKDISLNFDALISRVEGFAAGTESVKETHITIPQPIKGTRGQATFPFIFAWNENS